MSGLIFLLTAALTPALAGGPLVDALDTELQRSATELTLPESAPPYFVAYRLEDTWRVRLRASLGGMLETTSKPVRGLGVEVRTGSPDLDSANFDAGWRGGDGFERTRLPLADDPLALRTLAWLETDGAYKGAVENLARKEAAERRAATQDDRLDHAPVAPAQHRSDAELPVDVQPLTKTVRELSALMRAYPDIGWSMVSLNSTLGQRGVLTTEGTRVFEPVARTTLELSARIRATDGASTYDRVAWIVRRPEDLPSRSELDAGVLALAERLTAWQDLEPEGEEYIGPVLLEGQAALVLVEQLLVPALEGTPPEGRPPEGARVFTWDEDSGSRTLRQKRRVLPSGWTVFDQPQGDPDLASARSHDDEGVPTQDVTLVSNGIVRSHYSSRTPSKAVPDSNGHGFAPLGQLPRGTATWTSVAPERVTRSRRMHRQAMALAAAYDRDHYVIVRRIEDPEASADDPFKPFVVMRDYFGAGGGGGGVGVVDAVRIYADGHEEPVRGWQLAGLDVRMLRDVVAAGASTTDTLWHSVAGIRRGQQLITLTVPDLLLGEAELVPAGGGGEPPPLISSPLAEQR